MQKHRWFLMTLTVLMIVLLNSVLIYRVTPAQSASVSNADAAMRAYIKALYDPNAKYFYYDTAHTKYNDFWTEAISWDIVMDAYQRNPKNVTYRRMIDDVYDGFMAHNNPDDQGMSTACNTSQPFTLANNFNDDTGWWANASICAFTITHESRYLNCAKRLFDLIYASWDTSSDGGRIWWTRSHPVQKNVATNAPAVITATELSSALSDRSYLTKAEGIYDWMKSKLTNGLGMVYDNYDSGTLRMWQFTYDYGTFIGAADALYQATRNSLYLTDARNAANKSLSKVTTYGILNNEGAGDAGGFKGIYAQYLAELATTYHQSQYLKFLQMNATMAWTHRRNSDNLVGTNWTTFPAPTDIIQAHTAGSAVAILQVVP